VDPRKFKTFRYFGVDCGENYFLGYDSREGVSSMFVYNVVVHQTAWCHTADDIYLLSNKKLYPAPIATTYDTKLGSCHNATKRHNR
jgi:hypothetical protein